MNFNPNKVFDSTTIVDFPSRSIWGEYYSKFRRIIMDFKQIFEKRNIFCMFIQNFHFL